MARLLKALTFGPSESELLRESPAPSTQITKDQFDNYDQLGLLQPPFTLEQLVLLAETNPTHSACLDQKASDIVGSGPVFIAPDGQEEDASEANEAHLEAVSAWWESLFPEATPYEVLYALQQDFETVGFGALEVARDINDVVRALYHVPAHTLRAHRDGNRWCQMRYGQYRWFRAWTGDPKDLKVKISYRTGRPLTVKQEDKGETANEILIIKRPSRRSTHYGIPGYVSAIGHIGLSNSGRDYNLTFFQNNREVRHLIIVSGFAEDAEADEFAEELAESFSTVAKEPHKSMFLPVAGEARVHVEKMAEPQQDQQFQALDETTDTKILLAHRMPPDRVGRSTRGLLGASAALSANRIYQDSIVAPGQSLLMSRFQRFCEAEYKLATGKECSARWTLNALDLTDASADATIVDLLLRADVITMNEARAKLGMPPIDAMGEMTWSEFTKQFKPQPPALGGPGGPGGDAPEGRDPGDEKDKKKPGIEKMVADALQNLDGSIERLLEGLDESVFAS